MPLSEGGFALLNSVMSDGAPHFSVSALSFDSKEELLWMGNSGVSFFEISDFFLGGSIFLCFRDI